jgi:YbbR domain-containing protein
VRPRYVSIVIQGTPGILSFIKRTDLRAFLDGRDLIPGQHERKIQVKIPPDTVLIETYPENATVEISSKKL